MKVLSGLYPYGTYSGDILIKGEKKRFDNIRDAEKAGIAIIYQELALVQEDDGRRNILLGVEPKKNELIDWNRLYYETSRWLRQVGLNVDPTAVVEQLGVGQQQLVEIAKALSKKDRDPHLRRTDSRFDR